MIVPENPLTGKIVTIFGSSRPRPGDPEYRFAESLGEKIASSGMSVCTGGYRGIMEAVSKGASRYDVEVIGVTVETFSREPNEFVNLQIHTKSIYERLQRLIELGDAYVVLKGGTGTLVELSLAWELINKNIIAEKPIVITDDFWKPVIDLLDSELQFEGKMSCTRFLKIVKDVDQIAELIKSSILKSPVNP
ncbi:MAG: LOG family protein [Candidatus Kryptoniota bacterium]